jgi:hypothetical protein
MDYSARLTRLRKAANFNQQTLSKLHVNQVRRLAVGAAM